MRHEANEFFRFHVRLAEIEPPIFRRFLLATSGTFLDLHDAIQDACGWDDCHLFSFFDARRKEIATLQSDDSESDAPDAGELPLADYFAPGKSFECRYLYDFGDHWDHTLTLEAIEFRKDKRRRILLDGARAFPRDDVGGIGGYHQMVAAASGRPAPKEFRDWIDGWTPEAFDLAATAAVFEGQKRSNGRSPKARGRHSSV